VKSALKALRLHKLTKTVANPETEQVIDCDTLLLSVDFYLKMSFRAIALSSFRTLRADP
jgi:hypothetical protein